ncbi:MAG: STAS domain-containing protein [Actinobacteria bacterium]|nr:STAS domain-containing protein [Actinomycetota bacterium]
MEGELDIQVAAERKSALMALVDSLPVPTADGPVPDLTLNLRQVTELDTAGLQLLLLGSREAARRGARLLLVDPSPAVTGALALVHLELDAAGALVTDAETSR